MQTNYKSGSKSADSVSVNGIILTSYYAADMFLRSPPIRTNKEKVYQWLIENSFGTLSDYIWNSPLALSIQTTNICRVLRAESECKSKIESVSRIATYLESKTCIPIIKLSSGSKRDFEQISEIYLRWTEFLCHHHLDVFLICQLFFPFSSHWRGQKWQKENVLASAPLSDLNQICWSSELLDRMFVNSSSYLGWDARGSKIRHEQIQWVEL